MLMQGIQCLLQLPRANLLQLLSAAPSLLLAGPAAIEAHVQRVAGGLGLSTAATGSDALSRLLQVLLQLGTDALLDHNAAVQKVRRHCRHPRMHDMPTNHTASELRLVKCSASYQTHDHKPNVMQCCPTPSLCLYFCCCWRRSHRS
jgi:hypothetical protein